MRNMILLGQGGSIHASRVLAVASLRSAPVRRFLKAQAPNSVLNLCYGYPQRSLLLFDNGMVAVSQHDVAALSRALGLNMELLNEEGLPF